MTSQTRSEALVLFGITGDLARKMLLPALYELSRQGRLTEPVIGVSRGGRTVEELREHARTSIAEVTDVDDDAFAVFAGQLRLAAVDYGDPPSFGGIADHTDDATRLSHYLAIPPVRYVEAAAGLAAAGLNDGSLLVVEKPFGHDLASARELQTALTEHFPDERLRRVDHFLGKSAIEDLLTFRFANPLLNAALDRDHVHEVQITMAEDFDVADRGGFYDATGCLRDVVQNHLLQLFAYLTMEAPATADATDGLHARAQALRAVRTVDPGDYVRGQYTGYLDVAGVRDNSTTETYTALRLNVDTDRWRDVPFVIRTGKALATTAIEIIIKLKPTTVPYYTAADERSLANLVRLRISPHAGVTLDLRTQGADTPDALQPVRPRTDFTHLSGSDTVAYEHILYNAMTGDPRQFTSMNLVEESWRIVADILDLPDAPEPYAPGSWGPDAAAQLTPDRTWLNLEQGGSP